MPRVRGAGPRPVFLDRSGRRRRLVKIVGVGLGAVLAASLALIVAAVSTASPVHLPGFPDIGLNAGRTTGVTATPIPSGPTRPGSGGRTGPGPSAVPSSDLGPTDTASPSASSKRGRVPTQTPSHPTKK